MRAFATARARPATPGAVAFEPAAPLDALGVVAAEPAAAGLLGVLAAVVEDVVELLL